MYKSAAAGIRYKAACARRQVNPNIRKDKWTESEDKALMRLVKTYGCAWAEISRLMDGRTDQQCMGRWRRHLDPAIRRDAWTIKEDASLQARPVSRRYSGLHALPCALLEPRTGGEAWTAERGQCEAYAESIKYRVGCSYSQDMLGAPVECEGQDCLKRRRAI